MSTERAAHDRRDEPRALALVARFGRTSTAFAALGSHMLHWFDPDEPAMVAYVDTGRAWVAAGEPIASEPSAATVAERFVQAATAHGRRVAFFASEGVLASSPRFRRTLIGEQPVWDPQRWTEGTRGHRSMREQLRRARAKGVSIAQLSREMLDGDAVMRAHLEGVVESWLAARPMARMGFLVDTEPLRALEHRLLFVASRAGRPVALLSIAPVPARGGWLFEHLLREPSAPNGTAELLVDDAMRALAERGVRWVSLGLAPLAGPVSGWLRGARFLSRPFFNFRGLSAFKRKLRPDAWAPIYLAFPRERSSPLAMLDGLRAFAGRPLLVFALATALRGPRPLLTAMELALVPWTLALVLAPVSPWFPSAMVRGLWVGFDLLLLAALGHLRRRGGARLAAVLATAVSIDATLTAAQAAFHTVPALQGAAVSTGVRFDGAAASLSASSVAIVFVACLAPVIAASVLWGAARRLARLEQRTVDPAHPLQSVNNR